MHNWAGTAYSSSGDLLTASAISTCLPVGYLCAEVLLFFRIPLQLEVLHDMCTDLDGKC
jgi:hypothetical protein